MQVYAGPEYVKPAAVFAGPERFLVEEIRFLLKRFQNMSCIFECREANSVAHGLTQYALSRSVNAVWHSAGSSRLNELITADRTTAIFQ